jgi:hypothetical protein
MNREFLQERLDDIRNLTAAIRPGLKPGNQPTTTQPPNNHPQFCETMQCEYFTMRILITNRVFPQERLDNTRNLTAAIRPGLKPGNQPTTTQSPNNHPKFCETMQCEYFTVRILITNRLFPQERLDNTRNLMAAIQPGLKPGNQPTTTRSPNNHPQFCETMQ